MKKISSRTLSVALTAMILLPLMVALLPTVSNQPFVKGASSATITSDIIEGYAGDYVTVVGQGFTPNKDITFSLGNQLLSSLGFISSLPYYQRPSIYRSSTGEVHTDALGSFKIQLQVPKLKAGNYTIKAFDTETSATTNFKINARVLLRNRYAFQTHGNMQTPREQPSREYIGLFLAEGFVGDRLAIQLSGFDNGEPVEVKINTTTIGTFNVGFGASQGYYFSSSAATLPEMLGGQFTVTATGMLSGILATATFKVEPELFLARQTTPPPYNLGYPWLYSDYPVGGHFALGWYSSVNSAASSTFMLEATGLTGTAVQSVNVTYAGTTVTCTLSGTLTVSSRGSTQGVGGGTAPFTANTPFTVNSPTAQIASAINTGTILNVVVKTSGTGAATFTFQKQLVASQANLSETTGNTVWLEGTISSPGLHLSDKVSGVNELISTNLKASTSYRTSTVHSSGTTVEKTDVDAIAADVLTLFDQGSQPLSYVDANSNAVWNVGEDVYQDIDNSATVTTGDRRINTVVFGGSTYWPWSTVVGTDADVGRALVDFDAIQRPARDTFWYDTVYLDLNRDGIVSAGDTRISYDRESLSAASFTSDNNGFLAAWFTVPTIPGGGKVYNVNLWNFVADGGLAAGNSVTLEIVASLTVSAPTYQTLKYVAEGYTGVTLSGNGFFGAEQLTISIGGKHVTTSVTPTPDAFGVLSLITISSIPALAGGSQSIVAQGIFTEENTASASVFVTPALSVSPTSGYNLNLVTSVTVTGKGFEAGTYEVVLDGFGNSSSVASFTVIGTGDEAGQVNVAFNLPSGIEGAHTIDVVKTNSTAPSFFGKSFFTTNGFTRTGVSTNYPYPTDSEFPAVTINPSLQASPTATIVGGLVSVTGKGLKPTTVYYVWFSQRSTSASGAILVSTEPAELSTDAEGTLTATFTVPESSGGTRAVWVSTSNSLVNNDPLTGSPVATQISVRPVLCLGAMSGEVGMSVEVSFGGLTTGNEYQLWWYNPEEAKVGDILFGTSLVQVPQTALPLAPVTGAAYGNSTSQVTFTVPSTAENGKIYAVDLTNYGDRYSVLSQPVFFSVGKVASRITLSLTPTTVTEGESVAINGVVQPAMAVGVTIQITPPNGNSTTRTVTSASSGTFTDTFTPNSAGTWQVTAQWNGDATYAAYQSLSATVTVKPIDFSWTYALTGIAIGLIALIVGLLVTVYYFLYKRRPATTTATASTPTEAPK